MNELRLRHLNEVVGIEGLHFRRKLGVGRLVEIDLTVKKAEIYRVMNNIIEFHFVFPFVV